MSKEFAYQVIYNLQVAGFQAYLVGGAVRDMLLKREVKDWDVATSATPDEIEAIFTNDVWSIVRSGRSFGVCRISFAGRHVEVATFRKEGAYQDGRHPDGVDYSRNINDDMIRRDFTINAMYYDPFKDKLIDQFRGQEDLEKRIIRTVNKAEISLDEDNLRMLRAIRFAKRLDFHLDHSIMLYIQYNGHRITRVSSERICQELYEILDGKPTGVQFLLSTRMFEYLFANSIQDHYQVLKILTLNEGKFSHNIEEALAKIFVYEDANLAYKICKTKLGFSDKVSRRVFNYLDIFNKLPDIDLMDAADAHALYNHADTYEVLSTIAPLFYPDMVKHFAGYLFYVSEIGKPIVTGQLLCDLGYLPGPEFAAMLRSALNAQIAREFEDVEGAKEWVQKNYLS